MDGSEVASVATNQDFGSTELDYPVTLGSLFGGGFGFFNGYLDDIRFVDMALSDTDILAMTWYEFVMNNAVSEVDYAYDHQNRLIRRTEDDKIAGAGPIAEYYVYDGPQMALRFNDAGEVSNRYIWGTQIDHLLVDEVVTSELTAGTNYWALTDNLGSVRDVVRFDSANDETIVSLHQNYDSFGNRIFSSQAATEDYSLDFGFTGRQFDATTGLQNNLNRWYDAKVGRWISEDPIGFAAGDSNLYRYVGNSPTNGIDPKGLQFTVASKVYSARVSAKSFIYDILQTQPIGGTNLPDLVGPHLFNLKEDPKTDAGNTGDFRLFSSVTVHFKCSCGGKLDFTNAPKNEEVSHYLNWWGIPIPVGSSTLSNETGHEIESGGGREAPGVWGTMNVSGPNGRRINRSTYELTWEGWGRPNWLAEPSFQALHDRVPGINIWHRVTVTMRCNALGKGTVTAKLAGSRFPSHRLWVDGMQTQEIMQGPISSLWISQPGRPAFVK